MANSDEKLIEDKELILNNQDFKNKLKHPDYGIRPYNFLEIPFCPTLIELAELAYIVYTDLDGLSESEMKLPDGWALLTTARNSKEGNKYFGAAFWHSEHHQVLVAHRGTEISYGPIKNDVYGIMYNELSPQVNSACTFANMVVEDLKNDKVHFTFTGHSLGAWLAQVTTFTTEYLVIDSDGFRQRKEGDANYHPHTVAFESPGCMDMLRKVSHSYYERYDATRADERINDLDIVSYMSVANCINTCRQHAGTIFRIFPELSMNVIQRNFLHTITTHRMKLIKETVKKSSRIVEMIDWPSSKYPDYCIKDKFLVTNVCKACTNSDRSEYKALYKHATTSNDFHPVQCNKFGSIEVHYKDKGVDDKQTKINVFSKEEQKFMWGLKTCFNEYISQDSIKEYFTENVADAKVILVNDFQYTDADKEIVCETKEILRSVVNRFKQLFLWLPQVNTPMMEQIKRSPKAHDVLYSMKSKMNVSRYEQDEVHFEDIVELEKFLQTSDSNVLLVVASKEYISSSWPGRICYGILQGLESSANRIHYVDPYDKQRSFLNYNDLKSIASYGIDFVSKFKDESKIDNLLVLDFCEVDLGTSQMDPQVRNLLSSKVIGKKIIVLTTGTVPVLLEGVDGKTLNVPHWSQLKPYSRTLLLKRKLINFKEKVTSLEEIIDNADNKIWESIIDSVTLLKLISNEEITVGTRAPWLSDMPDAYSYQCKDVSLEDVTKASEDTSSQGSRFMISNVGILSDKPEWLKESGRKIKCFDGESSFEDFKEFCQEHQDDTIHWLEVSSSQEARWNHIYDGKFYFKRTFVQSEKVVLSLDFNKELTIYIKKDLFVISGISNEELLASRIEIDPELDLEKLKRNIRNGSIWMEQTEEEAQKKFDEQCGKHKDKKKSIHWLILELTDKNEYQLVWKRSQGSLSLIREYKDQVKSNKDVDEDEVVIQNRQVVIIADDPGMGKTTTLARLSHKIAEPAWVVFIDFNECLQAYNNLNDKDCSMKDLISIVNNEYLSSELAKNLFQYDLEHDTARQVYLIFDGFDEIREEGQSMPEDNVLGMIKYIKDSYTHAKIWMSTRNHKRKQLEDALSLFAVSFKGFEDKERNKYLKRYWQIRLTLSSLECDEKGKEIEEFLKKVEDKSHNLGSGITKFISIPLQMRMLAQVLQGYLEQFIERNSVHDFELMGILDLYKRFIQAKYDVYIIKKMGLPDFIKDVTQCWLKETLTSKHRHLAFQLLCSDDNVASNFEEHVLNRHETNELLCVGLIQSFNHSTFQFVHRTIAEFFTADLLYSRLKTLKGMTEPFPAFLMEHALLKPKFEIVRSFLNDLLVNFGQQKGVRWCDPPRLYSYDDETEQTVLHILATENNSVLIDFLLRDDNANETDRVSLVDRRDKNNMSALHLAAKNGCFDAVKVLLEKKASVNIVDRLGGTPLCRAACGGHEDVVRILLANKATVNCQDKVRDTPLHKAASLRHKNIVEMLLEAGADSKARNNTYQTPLHKAVKSGHEDVVKMLLGKPVVVDAKDNKEMTPLYWAASKGHENIVKILLFNGAQVNSSDKCGMTPLLVAGWKRHRDVLKLLLSDDEHVLGIDVNAQNKKKEIAVLHYVARAGFVDIINLLLLKGAKIDIADKSSRTPLLFAAGAGNHQVVLALLNQKSDPRANMNAQDSKGRTCLHLAAKQGHLDVVRVLLTKGANLNIKDVNNKTPIQTASEAGHENIYNLLLSSLNFMDR